MAGIKNITVSTYLKLQPIANFDTFEKISQSLSKADHCFDLTSWNLVCVFFCFYDEDTFLVSFCGQHFETINSKFQFYLRESNPTPSSREVEAILI